MWLHLAVDIVPSNMAVRLHKRGFWYAQRLIVQGRIVQDGRDHWVEHQPSSDAKDQFIGRHGWHRYGNWHLGIDSNEPAERRTRYVFLYGDFERLHRCGVLRVAERAGQRGYTDIEVAAAHLRGLLEVVGKPKP